MRRSPARPTALVSRTWWKKSSGLVRSRPRARRRRRAFWASVHPITRRTYRMRRGRWGSGAAEVIRARRHVYRPSQGPAQDRKALTSACLSRRRVARHRDGCASIVTCAGWLGWQPTSSPPRRAAPRRTAPHRTAEPRRGACWRWIESGSAAPLLAEGLPPYVGGSLSLPCRRDDSWGATGSGLDSEADQNATVVGLMYTSPRWSWPVSRTGRPPVDVKASATSLGSSPTATCTPAPAK